MEAVFGPDGPYDLNFIRVNAQERFYAKLKDVTEPESKDVRSLVRNLSVSLKKRQRRSVL